MGRPSGAVATIAKWGEFMKRRTGVAVAAMMLAASLGQPAAAAEPTLEQLSEIAAYLGANDVDALRKFLLLNPGLLEGNTTLASLLRDFMQDSSDVATYLDFEPDLRDAVVASTPVAPAPASRDIARPSDESGY